ncbi:MAG: leucine-rich repeat protein, partial [Muribaculaceae bacterium]|nr:leucine-rich repeat protein [Muribaculaceae bacterium]
YTSLPNSVTIPSSVTNDGKTYTVTEIGDYAFRKIDNLTSVSLPNTITKIGSEAFYRCKNLKTVNIPSGVTSIGNEAFCGCTSLTNITLPKISVIGERLFFGCKALTSLTIPSSVKTIWNYALSNTGLTSITIPSSVTLIGTSIFSYCTSLSSVSLPRSISSITESMFRGCSNLQSITIPSSVHKIEKNAFAECNSLATVNIPNAVDTIAEKAFMGCSSLTGFGLPSSITYIDDYAFQDCSKLSTLTLPQSLKDLGKSPFEGCTGLRTIYWFAASCQCYEDDNRPFNGLTGITAFYFGSNVTYIPSKLCYGLSALTQITIPPSVQKIGQDIFVDCSGLKTVNWNATACKGAYSITWPFKKLNLTTVNIGTNVTSMPDELFEWANIETVNWNAVNCADFETTNHPFQTSPKYFNFGNSVQTIPACLCYSMRALTSITVPASVTLIGKRAFQNCDNLETVVWNAVNCDCQVIEENLMPFIGCESLTTFIFGNTVNTIPNNICYGVSSLENVAAGSSVKTIGRGAFYNCSSLKSIALPASLQTIGYGAFYNAGLTEITIPANVYSIGDYAISNCPNMLTVNWNTNRFSAFSGLSNSVKTVNFGSNVTSIPQGICSSMQNLTKVTMTNSVTSIGVGAFSYCGIKTITLPESLKKLNEGAFYGSGLTTITIPASVNNIGPIAFAYCRNLTSIYPKMTSPASLTYGDNIFASVDKNACKLGVPKGTLSAYKNTMPWSEFFNITEVSTLKGDVNGDGDINVQDVTALIGYILGDTIPGFVLENANVANDDTIDVKDVTALINMILN